ncbi:hypothetical protein HK102_000171 [Quaeritorhiza haematococci]|nr:hypothetical protein HK102_000171 [Quaeritorhiza haematococci]
MLKTKVVALVLATVVAYITHSVTSSPTSKRIACGSGVTGVAAAIKVFACPLVAGPLIPFCMIGTGILGTSLGGLCSLIPGRAADFPRAENATDLVLDMSDLRLNDVARYSDQEIADAVLRCHNINGAQVCVNGDVLARAGQVTGGVYGCTSGHMRCVNDQIFTTCVHGEWQVRQFCGQGTRCQKHSDPNYVICGW